MYGISSLYWLMHYLTCYNPVYCSSIQYLGSMQVHAVMLQLAGNEDEVLFPPRVPDVKECKNECGGGGRST